MINDMDRIIKKHFWNVGYNGDVTLKESDLGWSKSLQQDSQSDHPETIFRYVVEIVGFNILFYWIKDENFYVIETEKDPIEVRKLYLNPDWDGELELFKATSNFGPNTASPGLILATYDNPVEIWDNLKINGVPIGEVLEESCIVELD